ncbi:MAG: tRNA 2-selenouridine(34) synthase MnmH [Chitinophagaceae bacterium]
MVQKINIEEFLTLAKYHPVTDVRSPAEYNHAHIPGAHSLPLFTDEERKIVGTTYKQKSREAAIKVGLDFFGPKMKRMIEEVEDIFNFRFRELDLDTKSEIANPQSKIILIYCWRGGMRSAGVAWLMDLYGFKVYTLIGGYKKFRNYVLDTFRLPFSFKILGGYTGSGKTELLNALKKEGEKVIDLEALACHKGSAFGNINMPKQPSQEMFENLLALELLTAVNRETAFAGCISDSIWLEDESQRIGDVNIPPELWKTMRKSPLYFLEISFEERLRHITDEYSRLDKERLINSIKRIEKRLGYLEAGNAINLIYENNYEAAFRILLKYYDKWYFKSLHNRENINSLLKVLPATKTGVANINILLNKLQPHE